MEDAFGLVGEGVVGIGSEHGVEELAGVVGAVVGEEDGGAVGVGVGRGERRDFVGGLIDGDGDGQGEVGVVAVADLDIEGVLKLFEIAEGRDWRR